jgi:NAD(P)-dependent dehydrogenase (short-subunit alcohol dehydrogenase family)
MPAETRTVIVTGAAHGIGAGIARHLAHVGWSVACADMDADAAQKIATEISGIGIGCDVGVESDVEPMATTSLDSWNRVLAINLTATFLLARTLAADLKTARGAIVTISSTRAHMSEPDTLAYSATKGGIVALTHALAMTMAPDVRVNCVSPGWIDTGKYGPLKPSDHAQHPVGRVGRPDDIAAAVAYLLSEAAGFVTGAELVVDGGMTRKMIYT